MSLRVGVDIGGTFTDLVAVTEDGRTRVVKSPTTPDDYVQGVFDCLDKLRDRMDLERNELLEACSPGEGGLLVHGSTIATNAVLEDEVSKTALLCTEGFRDLLLYREGGDRSDPFDWDRDYPDPLIPRYRIRGVSERINAEGEVEEPLDEDDVIASLEQFREWDVEAIAVCFLWSIVNEEHEKQVGRIIEREWPDVHYVLSHEVNPIIREYRRTSSTVLDASLGPIVQDYVRGFEDRLNSAGYRGSPFLVTASGGVMTPDQISERPIYTIDSGPAMNPVAGRMFAHHELGRDNVITADMGGTSFDVSTVIDGEINVSRETKIKDHILGINRVDTRSIGQGGGSIASVDAGGLLKVGPRSAGSDPGPACYGQGGQEPTVTDANLLLGYLNPDYFLGGQMEVDVEAARRVVDPIREKLDLEDVSRAAYSIWTTTNHSMVASLKDITVSQGIDPREFVLVAGGGACGLHVIPIARELGVQELLVPRESGVLSAVGDVTGDLIGEFSGSYYCESSNFDYLEVNDLLEELGRQAEEFLDEAGVDSGRREIQFFVEARYPHQIWELSVPLRSDQLEDEEAVQSLVEDFHAKHEQLFEIKEPDQDIECVYWRAKAVGEVADIDFRDDHSGPADDSAEPVSRRDVYFDSLGGFTETPIYRGDHLQPGQTIDSPAVIEEPTSTLVVFPGSRVEVTASGTYHVRIS